jgi:endonuclease/exonuclease/phosphatase family metal-dependent hydrolase
MWVSSIHHACIATMRKLAFVGPLALVMAACAADGAPEDEGASSGLLASSSQDVTTGCSGTTSTGPTATVKVMSINLRHDSDEWERRFEMIADEIVRLDPDLVGMQEVEIGKDQANKLNDLLAARGHAKYNLFTKRKSGFSGFFTGEGIGIMSRWPIVEKEHEDIGEMRVSVFVRVKHPSGKLIDMADTHLDHHGGPQGDADRDDEAKQTIDLLNRNTGCNPTFLTGDMNAKEESPALKRFFAAGLADSYRAVHGDETPTTGNTSPIKLAEGAEQNPRNRIDFILGRSAGGRTVTPTDSLVCFKNHDAKGFYPSDHLGVMTTYDVKF